MQDQTMNLSLLPTALSRCADMCTVTLITVVAFAWPVVGCFGTKRTTKKLLVDYLWLSFVMGCILAVTKILSRRRWFFLIFCFVRVVRTAIIHVPTWAKVKGNYIICRYDYFCRCCLVLFCFRLFLVMKKDIYDIMSNNIWSNNNRSKEKSYNRQMQSSIEQNCLYSWHFYWLELFSRYHICYLHSH